MTRVQLDQSGSEEKKGERKTLLDVPFDASAIDLDDIVPYTDLEPLTREALDGQVATITEAQQMVEILGVRKGVMELLFAREEDLAVAEIADLEAEQHEARADDDRKLTKMQTDMLQAQARRIRILAARSRCRARHRELEILAHLKRKGPEGDI